jgi:hypothetical protein
MTVANATEFLCSSSEKLANPQAILLAGMKLLEDPEKAGNNTDLVRSLIEIANGMIGDIAVGMEDFDPNA